MPKTKEFTAKYPYHPEKTKRGVRYRLAKLEVLKLDMEKKLQDKENRRDHVRTVQKQMDKIVTENAKKSVEWAQKLAFEEGQVAILMQKNAETSKALLSAQLEITRLESVIKRLIAEAKEMGYDMKHPDDGP